jgi:choline dehydrogenase-like flavoprotein
MTGPWDGPAGRPIGPELKDALMNGVNRMLNILVITDDDVEAQNRVLLSALPGDEHGPVPKVVFRARDRTARTQANREFLVRQATALLRGAGARKVFRLDWAPLILHVQSTMRMGISADDSVLDDAAEARWVKRLFIADNSALANALGGPNPTLTTQALATRTAEKIVQRYFGGDPWVGRESPIVSTHDAVTQAIIARGL